MQQQTCMLYRVLAYSSLDTSPNKYTLVSLKNQITFLNCWLVLSGTKHCEA